jgi:hypothetical protein
MAAGMMWGVDGLIGGRGRGTGVGVVDDDDGEQEAVAEIKLQIRSTFDLHPANARQLHAHHTAGLRT